MCFVTPRLCVTLLPSQTFSSQAIFIPVFSPNPLSLELRLTHTIGKKPGEEVKHLALRSFSVNFNFESGVENNMPPRVGVAFILELNLPDSFTGIKAYKMPNLFYMKGTYAGGDIPMKLEGGMVGFWMNPMGQDWLALGDIRAGMRATVHDEGGLRVTEFAISGTAFMWGDPNKRPDSMFATGKSPLLSVSM